MDIIVRWIIWSIVWLPFWFALRYFLDVDGWHMLFIWWGLSIGDWLGEAAGDWLLGKD